MSRGRVFNSTDTGFTLIEQLLYIGIFVIAAGLLSGILMNVIRVQNRETSTTEVSDQAQFLLKKIQNLIYVSSLIEIDASSPTSTLKLRMRDSAKDPTLVFASGTAVYYQEGAADALAITSELISVSGLMFAKMPNPPAKDIVQIDFTVDYANGNPQSQFSKPFHSAVSRVSASVFDSGVTPTSSSVYDIGTSTQRWKNISVSNLVDLGQLASDPSFAPYGAMYYNTATNMFRGYADGTWISPGSPWVSTSTGIFYGNFATDRRSVIVGIATAAQTDLSVNGGLKIYNGYGVVGISSGGTQNYLIGLSTSTIYIGSTGLSETSTLQSASGNIFQVSPSNKLRIGSNMSLGVSYMLDVTAPAGSTSSIRFGTTSSDTVIVGAGTGKLDAGVVDPIYSISGQKYATYLPGMTGVREETTGVIELQATGNKQQEGYAHAVDLHKLERGSDLWLFWQVTDFGEDWRNLAVMLSPDSGYNVWYKKEPDKNRLIIYGENAGVVSYRLSAPRFDWRRWPNTTADQVGGLRVDE